MFSSIRIVYPIFSISTILLNVIGNDIVDLKSFTPHPRFRERVCAPQERGDLPLLWACKEASYKLLKKRDASLSFIPKHFVCNPLLTECQYEGKSVFLHIEKTLQYIHVIAHEGSIESITAAIDLLAAGSESEGVRALAVSLLNQRGYPNCRIGGVPPRIYQEEKWVDVLDLSLSHDGPYLAATIQI